MGTNALGPPIDMMTLHMLLHIHCFIGKTNLSTLVDTQEVQS